MKSITELSSLSLQRSLGGGQRDAAETIFPENSVLFFPLSQCFLLKKMGRNGQDTNQEDPTMGLGFSALKQSSVCQSNSVTIRSKFSAGGTTILQNRTVKYLGQMTKNMS